MNCFCSFSVTNWNRFFSFSDYNNRTEFKNKIYRAASSAINLLKFSLERVYKQQIDRIRTNNVDSISLIPTTEPEKKLLKVCYLAIKCPGEVKEEILIQQARDLIKEGAEIHSIFANLPCAIEWLREHCAEELHKRGSVSKKGLELIDFETMLPLDWEAPHWLSVAEKLEIPQDNTIKSNTSSIEPALCGSIRDWLRPLAEKINNYPISTLFILSCLNVIPSSLLSLDWRITLIFQAIIVIIFPDVFAQKILLNQEDIQRMHAKALQNPLYEALWKKVEISSSTTLEFAPLFYFLRPGLTKDDVSLAHYDSINKKIRIYQGVTELYAFEAIVFESANAYQTKRFKEVIKKLNQGKLPREEYVRLSEYIEWETESLQHQIMDFGKTLGWTEIKLNEKEASFLKQWEKVNRRFPLDIKNAHADMYRHQWDRLKFLYFIRHPEKASSQEDWINKISGTNDTPLEILVWMPEIALLWKTDPFIQLIDKGANIHSNLINQICSAAIRADDASKSEYRDIHVSRIRKLLDQGNSVPSSLADEEKTWLEENVKTPEN